MGNWVRRELFGHRHARSSLAEEHVSSFIDLISKGAWGCEEMKERLFAGNFD